jgi:tetratricopeptide (TPR) repeat protein
LDPPARETREGQRENQVDTQTRHALKQDKFAQATASGVSWIGEHRAGVLRWVIGAGVALVLAIGALVFWNVKSSAGQAALGEAIDAYTTPLNTPGAPAQPGFFNSAAERAKAANQKFLAVAQDYGWLPTGAKAHYFAGITYRDLGQMGPAESELKTAAGAWNRDTANLAKLALAGLYHQTGRDSQAIDLYNELAARPSRTVTTAVAQLALADLYVAQGKQDLARGLWAKIKDADKDGMAGQLAAQRLAGR